MSIGVNADAGDSKKSCTILTAEITSKPEALTADADPQFSFTSASGVTPALGFECELQSSDAKGVSALHGWRTCESPAKYQDLADGSYAFGVRVKGEELAETWRFVVDISPPATSLLPVRRRSVQGLCHIHAAAMQDQLDDCNDMLMLATCLQHLANATTLLPSQSQVVHGGTGAATVLVRWCHPYRRSCGAFTTAQGRQLGVCVQDFGHPRGSALAVQLPAKASASQIAAFAMSVRDRSDTASTCKLTAPRGADVRLTGQISPGSFRLNEEYACTSPQVFSIVTAGSYTFETYAVDKGGNRERPPQRHRFGVAFAAGAVYTQVLGPVPWGPTNERSHALELSAIEGTADGAGEAAAGSAGFEYAAARLKRGEWAEGDWQPVDGNTLEWQVRRALGPPPVPMGASSCQPVLGLTSKVV